MGFENKEELRAVFEKEQAKLQEYEDLLEKDENKEEVVFDCTPEVYKIIESTAEFWGVSVSAYLSYLIDKFAEKNIDMV